MRYMAVICSWSDSFDAPNHPSLATFGTDFDYWLELTDELTNPKLEPVIISDDEFYIQWCGRKWPIVDGYNTRQPIGCTNKDGSLERKTVKVSGVRSQVKFYGIVNNLS